MSRSWNTNTANTHASNTGGTGGTGGTYTGAAGLGTTNTTNTTGPNTNHNRRQLIDGVLWEAKPVRLLLLGALVPVGLGLFDVADLGLPTAVSWSVYGGLTLFMVLGYALYRYRKLSIGPHGLVFHGLFRTRGLRWEDIVAVQVKLKVGKGDSPCYAVVRCSMRDGHAKRHTINFIGEEMLPHLAVDLRWYAAQRGIAVQVKSTDAVVRAVDAVEAGAAG
ncbi:hypothetical protein [Streptomyces sp. SID3343]|uniref:hypothetical protein n=1 Tax=Streptomyces sp. SID3343 TaxID=2690260 RepID=UPI00136CCE0F|nr:hypothetical protein [Streptomyces sp. SID3343]MYV98208.1 hypothetical protein [Streptomyces sp. SID3343]